MNIQVPEYIRTLVPYVPGKSIQETQREYGIPRIIKLASNENPLGPSPQATKAIADSLADLHRYPDASGFQLKQALAQFLQIPYSSIVLGNGSNEVIDNLIRTFSVAGDAIVTPQGSFVAYQISAQIHGVSTLYADVNSEFKINIEDLIKKVRENEKVKLVFIANPNNPTGTYLPTGEMEELIRKLAQIRKGSVVLVLDYAYWEYVSAPDLPDPMRLLGKYSNLIILRTFSKIYGLAGLRVGYGILSEEMAGFFEKVRQPFNVSFPALQGATAALTDKAFVERSKALNTQGLRFWEESLSKMGIPFISSQGNFILADFQKGIGISGVDIYKACLEEGIVFRPLANYGLPGYLRLTVGTAEENTLATHALESVLLRLKDQKVARESQKSPQKSIKREKD